MSLAHWSRSRYRPDIRKVVQRGARIVRFFPEFGVSAISASLNAILPQLLSERSAVDAEPFGGYGLVAARMLKYGPQERRLHELEESLVEKWPHRIFAVGSDLSRGP